VYVDPLELFRDAVAALNKADWLAVAALCDPASLRHFKRTLISMIAVSTEQTGKITTHDLMRAVPNMPRAVAEYQVAQFRESVSPKRRLNAELPSVKSSDELESMTPANVFAAWLEGKSLRRQIEREVSRGRLTRASAAQVLEQVPAPFNFHGMAFVPDEDHIGYVIYRHGPPASSPDVDGATATTTEDLEFARELRGRTAPMASTVRKQSDGGWLFVADTDFLMVSQMQVVAEADDPG
jgi:hypothetical protein